MQLRLVSFKLCPFVQRVAIALNQKSIAYEIEYIELSNPPNWFLELSPFKKVPLLQVDNQVLLDSTAINEYLEDAYPNNLHPSNLVLRAINRSWIEHSNQCMWSAFHLSIKETEKEFVAVRDDLFEQFDKLEPSIKGLPFFNGADFSLVDASYAPLLQRLDFLNEIKPGVLDKQRHPKIVAWKDALMRHTAVNNSCVPELKTLYNELLWKRQGYISGFLDKTKYNPNVQKSIY
jgi:glutathione S-transferase